MVLLVGSCCELSKKRSQVRGSGQEKREPGGTLTHWRGRGRVVYGPGPNRSANGTRQACTQSTMFSLRSMYSDGREGRNLMGGHQRMVHGRCRHKEQAGRECEQGRGRPVLQLERAQKALGHKVGRMEPQLPERMVQSDGMVRGEGGLEAFFSDDAHPRSGGHDKMPPSPCLLARFTCGYDSSSVSKSASCRSPLLVRPGDILSGAEITSCMRINGSYDVVSCGEWISCTAVW